MHTQSAALLFVSVLTLSACQTSSLSEAQTALVPATEQAFSGELREIDKNQSVISFVGKSDIINHEGKFNTYNATVSLDATNPSDIEKAAINVEIDLTSVEVDAAGLQGHLLREDFFATEEHPKATFTSTKIVKTSGNRYEVTGNLMIKGVTKTVTIVSEITNDYLTAQYDLPRAEFGIGNDSYGKKLLEPTVPVNVKLVFKK